jgi:hypothetical protein
MGNWMAVIDDGKNDTESCQWDMIIETLGTYVQSMEVCQSYTGFPYIQIEKEIHEISVQ